MAPPQIMYSQTNYLAIADVLEAGNKLPENVHEGRKNVMMLSLRMLLLKQNQMVMMRITIARASMKICHLLCVIGLQWGVREGKNIKPLMCHHSGSSKFAHQCCQEVGNDQFCNPLQCVVLTMRGTSSPILPLLQNWMMKSKTTIEKREKLIDLQWEMCTSQRLMVVKK